MTFSVHPVILCGGSGTRLWPLSTPQTPKQFLALTSHQSMIEETADRFRSTTRSDLKFVEILVVGSKRHETLLEEQLPDANIILEPVGRNSAPAIAAACMVCAPEDLVLILPADHDIRDIDSFHEAISIAAKAAEEGSIVTFGVTPTFPATGYGYIKSVKPAAMGGALDVEAFIEKPDLQTAQSYLDDGSYYWNAGIFLFQAGVMLEALELFAPEINAGTREALGNAEGSKNTLQSEAFAATPSISIDYAVMEKATNVKTVPVSMGWSDVGGYRALHELLTNSPNGNYMSGPVHVQNSTGLYIRSEGPAVSINGISNVVVVATENEVMITAKDDDGAVKSLGQIVQNDRAKLNIPVELRQKAHRWLWTTFEAWSEIAWDQERGGFVEQTDMAGDPDLSAYRRVRVQARQVFSFSKAIELNWRGGGIAYDLVNRGLEHIDLQLRHPYGGWVHIVDAYGRPVDEKRDLYDHAFIVLAGATAHKATENPRALAIARDAMSFITSELRDLDVGGWFEADPASTPRRSNPHMHLLEAMLAYESASGDESALDVAREIVWLFESKFFNPRNDVMGEYFDSTWAPETSENNSVFEPGHHYEWAYLLYLFEQRTGHDTRSWRRRLINRADQTGLNPKTNFALNAVKANGQIVNGDSRLWHQLERFRAYLHHPEQVSLHSSQQLLSSIFASYLDRGPKGGWIDEIDATGKPISRFVPASMLYHVVTALETLI
ncbi:MAG: AGE family epimerase/isomerase [Pseudomonadota bacterium]